MENCLILTLKGASYAQNLPLYKNWQLIKTITYNIVEGTRSYDSSSGLKKTDFSEDKEYGFVMKDPNGVVANGFRIKTTNGVFLTLSKLPTNTFTRVDYSDFNNAFFSGDLYCGPQVEAADATANGTVIVSIYKEQ